MLLNVQRIINAPGERMDFQFALDLSDVDFGGLYPAQNPVVVTGDVRNTAGMLLLAFTAGSTLKSVCDRCLKSFDNPLSGVSTLWRSGWRVRTTTKLSF